MVFSSSGIIAVVQRLEVRYEVRAYPVSVASPMSCVAAGAFLPRNTTSRTRLPPSEACPAILSRFSWIASESERRIECCVGPRARALEEHQFVACDGHAPPSVLDVLAALRGRTVALVGDSTIQQLWTSLVAELHWRVGISQSSGLPSPPPA